MCDKDCQDWLKLMKAQEAFQQWWDEQIINEAAHDWKQLGF